MLDGVDTSAAISDQCKRGVRWGKGEGGIDAQKLGAVNSRVARDGGGDDRVIRGNDSEGSALGAVDKACTAVSAQGDGVDMLGGRGCGECSQCAG